MSEYLSPGVYVEEIDAGPKPIEGVSTSTVGAVGVTEFGPTEGKPVLVSSFAEFQRIFGGPMKEPAPSIVSAWSLDAQEGGRFWNFPLSVKGFFDNGGQRIYVKRVISAAATAASATLLSEMPSIEFERGAEIGSSVLYLRHLLGVGVGSTLKLHVSGAYLTEKTKDGKDAEILFTVQRYDATTRTVSVTPPLPVAVRARRDFLTLSGKAAEPPPISITASARDRGNGNKLSICIRPVIGATFSITSAPGAKFPELAASLVKPIEISSGPRESISVEIDRDGFVLNERVHIGDCQFIVTSVPAAGQPVKMLGLRLYRAVDGSPKFPVGTKIERVRRLAPQNGNTVFVSNGGDLYPHALVELDNGDEKEFANVAAVNGNQVTLTSLLQKSYYDGARLRVVELEVAIQALDADRRVLAAEVFSNLRLYDDKSTDYFVTSVNRQSRLVRLSGPTEPIEITALNMLPGSRGALWQDLEGGNDRLDQLRKEDFIGVDGGSGHRTGLQALEEIDEISLVIAPQIWSRAVQSAMIEHCESLKDRFAILDPRDGMSIEEIREFREVIDTKYAALYYPWLEVNNPRTGSSSHIAPSGHMAGIYARVDVERGVHKAPANEVIRGITKIAQDVTKREQDMLNPRGINALRFFPGRGFRVWGARTLSSDASWKYINVRRLFIFVEESIDEGTQWVVFEPNDEPLWARVRQTITSFLTTVWRNGALQGTKADEAFFVKCDRTTMTQDDIDNGRLICVIGIAPVKPAEFVIFRIQQKTLEQKTS